MDKFCVLVYMLMRDASLKQRIPCKMRILSQREKSAHYTQVNTVIKHRCQISKFTKIKLCFITDVALFLTYPFLSFSTSLSNSRFFNMLLATDGELRTKWLGFEPRLLRPITSQIDKTVTLLHKCSLHTKSTIKNGRNVPGNYF